MATICWASTSSALRGTTVVSISPSRIRRATTAHSSRSARNLGKMRPRLTSPTECPARPIRCSPRATDLGDSTWMTRSTAPMSMPSSSDEVATRHGSSPALSISSTTMSLLARQRAVVGARDLALGQLVQPQRQPLGPAPVVDEQDRRAVRVDQLEQLGVDGRPDRAAGRLGAAGERIEVGRRRGVRLDHRVDRHLISRSSSLRTPVSTIRQLRRGPTRKRPISSSGFWVADSPIRWTSRPAARVSRSKRERQVRAPLGRGHRVDLVDDARLRAGEQLLRAPGQHQVQRLGGRDQDVRRLAEHRLALALRGVAGAHRDLEVGADAAQRHAQVAVDVVGERLERRDVDEADVVCARRRDRPAGRSPTGTRRASCPTRWAPRSGRARPTRSPARPGPAPAWAR